MERHGLSQRRACRLVGLDRSTLRYQRKRPDDAAVRQRRSPVRPFPAN